MPNFAETKSFLDALITEADLDNAVKASPQWFQETHHLDIKELPPEPKKMDELEKDLAAMTFDGGFLVYGIDEGPPVQTKAFPVAKHIERIDQAASHLAPPLRVRSREIPAAAVGDGYIVVEIPPSPARVHLTPRGTVPWRDNTTTRVLTASERLAITDDYREIEQRFDEVVARDLYASNAKTEHGIYFRATVGARPLFPMADLLLDPLQNDPRNMQPAGLAWSLAVSAQAATSRLADAYASQSTAVGGVFVNEQGTGVHAVSTTETGIAIEGRNPFSGADRFEVEADGSFLIRTANIGDVIEYPSETRTVILDSVLLLMAHQAAYIAKQISERTPGYSGPWLFGTYVRTADALPHSLQPPVTDPLNRTRAVGSPSFSRDDYRRIVPASNDRLSDPKAVARDLFGTLMHQFGTRPHWVNEGLL